MNALTTRLKASPLLARVLPFVVFIVLTACQGSLGPESHFWVYLAKCVVGGMAGMGDLAAGIRDALGGSVSRRWLPGRSCL